MNKCRWIPEIERWFDGESANPDAAQRHVAACPVCASHLAEVEALRSRAKATAGTRGIADAQFPAFLAGIRERVEMPARRTGGFWALASLAAAALIVAVSMFVMFSSGPKEALATEVEACSTEMTGATVTTYNTDNGTTTVWVSMPEDDVW